MTVAPSRSRFATTSAAMEPGEPPVTTATSPLCSKVEASIRACAAWASRPRYSAMTAASSPAPVISSESISPWAKRTRSSRADAQRSSSCTALSASKLGATRRGQSEPSSAVTRSTMAALSSASANSVVGACWPNCASKVRAVVASAEFIFSE